MLCVVCGLAALLQAVAQQFSIDWHRIGAGGGVSTGHVYSVSGTIGQPEASGTMTNGQFSLTGGFWAMPVAIQTEGAPVLVITPASPGFVTISWTPSQSGFVLQEAAALTGADWITSPTASTNPIVIPASFPAKYYRLSE